MNLKCMPFYDRGNFLSKKEPMYPHILVFNRMKKALKNLSSQKHLIEASAFLYKL